MILLARAHGRLQVVAKMEHETGGEGLIWPDFPQLRIYSVTYVSLNKSKYNLQIIVLPNGSVSVSALRRLNEVDR
jgi:hypothetical protein